MVKTYVVYNGFQFDFDEQLECDFPRPRPIGFDADGPVEPGDSLTVARPFEID